MLSELAVFLLPLLPIPLQGDISVPGEGGTPAQFWIAVGVVLVVAAVTAALRYRTRYAGLDEDRRRHKARLTAAAVVQSPRTVRLSRADLREVADEVLLADLRALIPVADDGTTDGAGGDGDADAGDIPAPPERVTLLGAAREAWWAFRAAWAPLAERVPWLARRLLQLAWLVAVLGAVAVSTDAIVRALVGGPGLPSLDGVVTIAVDLSIGVWDAGTGAVLAFPFAGVVFSLALAYGLLVAELWYQHWYVVATLLVLAAAAVTLLERRVSDDLERRLYHHRADIAIQATAAVVAVWLAGVVPAALGQVAGLPQAGALVGFVLAVGVGAGAVAVGARRFWRRLSTVAHLARDADRDVRWYLLVRRGSVMLAAAAAPLVVIYLAVIVVGGRGAQVLAAFGRAPIATKLAIGLVVVGLFVGAALGARRAWPDVRRAVGEAWGRAGVRLALLQQGSALAGGAVAYLAAVALSGSIIVGLLAALVGVAIALGLSGLVERARHRVYLREPQDRRARGVTFQGYLLEDADGNTHPYLVINGKYTLAREDPDRLAAEALQVARALVDGDDPPQSFARWYADDLVGQGLVDEGQVIDAIEAGERVQLADVAAGGSSARAWEHARKALVNVSRPVGSLTERDDVDDEQGDIPDAVWEARQEALRRDGVLRPAGAGGDALRLERDPWAREG